MNEQKDNLDDDVFDNVDDALSMFDDKFVEGGVDISAEDSNTCSACKL